MRIPNYPEIVKFAKKHGLTDEDVYNQYRLGYCKLGSKKQPTASLSIEFHGLQRKHDLWTDDIYQFIEEVSETLGDRPNDNFKLVPIDATKPITVDNLKWTHFYHQGNYGKPKPPPRFWTKREIMDDLHEETASYEKLV